MPDGVTNYQFGSIPMNLLDYVKSKPKSSKYYFEYLLCRTKKIFKYKNLPDTIEEDILERYLQLNGVACVTKYHDKLYVFNGSLGGQQDVYYRPTVFVVSNPHLDETFSKNIIVASQLVDYNKQPTDSQPGVLMRNDDEWVGLAPLIARYAVLMSENCLTIRSADVMLRIIALITAKSDKTLKSAQDYLKRLENGEFGVIGDSSFSEGINMQSPPSNNGSYLTQFIELQQYLKGSFFAEIGLRANYNMKREAIGTGESSMDEDAILPLIDNMMECRRKDVEKINNLYGTSISVDYNSAWLKNLIESNIAIISQLTEASIARVDSADTTEGDGELDQVGSTRDDMGDVGTTRDKETDNGEQAGNQTDEEIGRRDTDESGVESSDTGSTGESSTGEDSGTGEGTEVRNIPEDRRVESESEINDIGGNVVDETIEDVVEKAVENLEVGKGVEQNELLGQSEGSGNEEDTSDDGRNIQSDAVSVESGNNG